MTSPRAKGPYGFVPVTESVCAHPQRNSGPSHEKAVLRYGWALYPAPVALLPAAYVGAARLGLTMAFVSTRFEESSFLWSLLPSPKCWPSNAEQWLQEFLPPGRAEPRVGPARLSTPTPERLQETLLLQA